MKKTGNREVKGIFLIIALIFLLFLVYPVIRLLVKSFWGADGATIDFYVSVLSGKGFLFVASPLSTTAKDSVSVKFPSSGST